MAVGALHTIEFLELFYWLEAIDFDGWYSLDIFPYRDESIGIAHESFQWIKDLRRVIFHIGMDKIAKVIESGDAVQASKMIREAMFSLPKE